ncbi:MAG: hypothetical protein ACUVTM_00415 [Candidatus Bathyarchaeia archaeon]|jgi:hypothetical protein|nr:hypothetical protein [Candidatus Bathyarchaeota archaeon]MBS7628828.1 hypothetical protein [Candidatus Bathyarchaeota archaeon]MBS7651118.1 hypothetical protein [Candidatus Bathyarchaeota archaeon]
MTKHKTTMQIDDKLWKRFLQTVIKKHGTTKKSSLELEAAISEYLERQREES